ncbi:rho guanine nucleotide exchange factor 19-like [Scyliorhinus canicula]|uniref:rho guanine nucleotide exchange factor 19-like n=1 Tax=Scyliorhinus canicula TaxID=7830 RepID=UPI0018F4633D|nr:rho guanine nucleotide exchange factor 19-like [Scyliorhinus canicula]
MKEIIKPLTALIILRQKKCSSSSSQAYLAMFEVITSEESYLGSLTVAVNHFSECPELVDMLTLTDRHMLFSNMQEVKDTTERLDKEFVQVLKKLEEQPICQRQLLKSFLILPFQCITRLTIMLEIVQECNENVKRMRQIEDLVSLEKQLEFARTKFLPLISQTRFLVKEGELNEISGPESGQKPGSATTSIYIHLFNDLLLLSRKE